MTRRGPGFTPNGAAAPAQAGPAAVSRRLIRHPAVREAAVLPQVLPDGRTALTAYVVAEPGYLAEQTTGLAGEHVDGWRDVFEHVYRPSPAGTADDAALAPGDPALDRAGWNSSYTGTVMTRHEVGEAIDGVVDQVAALPHRRVLEVGCGTGMLLLRLAPGAERYWATDLSARVLHALRRRLDASPHAYAGVTLLEREGTDFSGFADDSLDLVLLNSVVQYFPSASYLRRMLREAVRVVRPGGAVLIGDVRDLRLLQVLHSSVEVWHADSGTPAGEVRRRVTAAVADEGELLVDPAFFAALAAELPGVCEVGLQLKRGTVANELTKFRYDVTLRVGARPGPGAAPHPRPEPRPGHLAVPWDPARWSVAAVESRIERGELREAVILDVPDSRTARDVATWRALTESPADARLGDLLDPGALDGLDPGLWWAIGRRRGLTVAVTPPRSGTPGRYDVAVSRPGATPPWAPRTRRSALTNAPLHQALSDDLALDLRAFLTAHLPADLVPARLVIVDEIPSRPDGTVDAGRLPGTDDGAPE
ncbi:class I SAM-dependent methyltransferase [Actinacidiphila acidipaludis]|uniref:Methyltransferase domain-containing protein n=1 Tax=Actinacidiphila acidipaludis TaxID=2873382 RepID=A0ABS7QAY5_9ACTN|nr:class I SAM-dependent methyltransferase [Streptomyces acidipaludis]MBY8880281.1 methyltransferase domain-containing protein [Streptomyces acidipaludis]